MTKKKLNEQQEMFLEALGDPANKGDIRKAMDAAGYSKSYTITHIIQSLGEEILETTLNILKVNGPKAALGLVSVVDGDSGLMAREKIAAANAILDRIGVTKKDQVEVTHKGSSVFILPAKREADESEIY